MTWTLAGFVPVGILVIIAICEAETKEPCKDRLGNCDAFNNSTCTKYTDWAKTNCAKTCGKCEGACPEGWSLYKADNTCFKGFGLTKERIINCKVLGSWEQARTRCQQLGGDLVVIKDINKHVFISDKFRHIKNEYYWIGIKNVGQLDYDFQYVDGTKLGPYQPWVSYPSKGKKVENCVLILSVPYGSKEPGKWNNYDCTICKPCVCQTAANEIIA